MANPAFERTFQSWLETSLGGTIPSEEKAFAFNLHERADVNGVTFGVELVGTNSFSAYDPDWGLDVVWQPPQRMLMLPLACSGGDLLECFARVKGFVAQTLTTDSAAVRRLKASQGVGVGFADGDIEVLWTA